MPKICCWPPVGEPLEPRLLLASITLDEFQPLKSNSTWQYAVTKGRKSITETTQVMPQRVRVGGVLTTQVRTTGSDGSSSSAFLSTSRQGRFLHMENTQEKGESRLFMTYVPPVREAPHRLEIGQTHRASSEVRLSEAGGGRADGDLALSLRAVRWQRVSTPAGTFSCIRVRLTMKATFSVNGRQIESDATSTIWAAKGVGTVKSVMNVTTTMYSGGDPVRQESKSESSVLKTFSTQRIRVNSIPERAGQ